MMRALSSLLFVACVAACVATTEPNPEPPVVGLVETPTNERVQVVRGTKQAGTAIDVVTGTGLDVLVALDGNTTWEAPLALVEGLNTFNLVATDAHGHQSLPTSVSILVDIETPKAPVVDPLPARTQDAQVTITGTIGESERLIIDGDVVATSGAHFSVVHPLAIVGDNVIRLAARDLAGNESSIVEEHVNRVTADSDAPVVDVATPSDGALVREAVTVSGVESDASPTVTITVCAGTCPNAAHTSVVPAGAGGAFTTTLDLTGLADDGPVALTISAEDEWGNTTAHDPLVIDLVRASSPAAITGVSPSRVSTSSGTAPFDVDVAWLDAGGVLRRSLNAGPAFAPTSATIATGVTTFAATHADGDPSIAVAYVDATGLHFAPSSGLVEDVATGAFTSIDIAQTDGGSFAIAAVAGGVVEVFARTGVNAWSAPSTVSDAVTAGANANSVSIAFRTASTVAVAWVESSARDGSANDADVVAVRASPTSGALSPIVVVSTDAGAFVDGASSAPKLAPLGSSTAIAWIDDGDAWITALDDSAFTSGAPAPSLAASNVDDIALASTGAELALAAHDAIGATGVHVQIGASPAEVASSSPALVPDSAQAQSVSIAIGSPAVSGALDVLHVASVKGADVLVFPLEIAE